MKVAFLRALALFLLVLPSSAIWACPKDQYNSCTLGVCICLPKIDGDVGKGAEDTKREANRLTHNVARELGKTPQALAECAANVSKCATEIASAPVALSAQSYIDGLYRQSEGRVHPLTPEFISLAQPYYSIDLHGVTYADDIDTGHGMVLAYCDRIFFTRSGNLWVDKNELHLVLHELEHLVQCQKRGRSTFLAEYIVKGLVDISQGRFNVHDSHEMERAADAKADRLTDALWDKIQSGAVPIPIAQRGIALPSQPVPRLCQTHVGTCPIPASSAPSGSSCFCYSPYGYIPGLTN
jgi:hypothetical protein